MKTFIFLFVFLFSFNSNSLELNLGDLKPAINNNPFENEFITQISNNKLLIIDKNDNLFMVKIVYFDDNNMIYAIEEKSTKNFETENLDECLFFKNNYSHSIKKTVSTSLECFKFTMSDIYFLQKNRYIDDFTYTLPDPLTLDESNNIQELYGVILDTDINNYNLKFPDKPFFIPPKKDKDLYLENYRIYKNDDDNNVSFVIGTNDYKTLSFEECFNKILYGLNYYKIKNYNFIISDNLRVISVSTDSGIGMYCQIDYGEKKYRFAKSLSNILKKNN